MTLAEWHALGEQLFGPNEDRWRFKCPTCGHVTSHVDANSLPIEERNKLKGAWNVTSECIGRYLDGIGCNWAAYGLFRGPHFVVREDGTETAVFAFAPPSHDVAAA